VDGSWDYCTPEPTKMNGTVWVDSTGFKKVIIMVMAYFLMVFGIGNSKIFNVLANLT
jgi:hypothetical protein